MFVKQEYIKNKVKDFVTIRIFFFLFVKNNWNRKAYIKSESTLSKFQAHKLYLFYLKIKKKN